MKSIQIQSKTLEVMLHPLGARIASIRFSGKELALSYGCSNDFESDPFYLGASIGPITNRIAKSTICINKESFSLPANEGLNCLHSGGHGFDKEDWQIIEQSASHVVFRLDYDLLRIGMRGRLRTNVTYRVNEAKLTVEYTVQCNVDTYVNTTNHVYLNLSGHSVANDNHAINDHRFKLYAKNFVEVDKQSIPTGKLFDVPSPFDYKINQNCKIKTFESGIDHHFNVAEHNDTDLKLMLEATSTTSGISLAVNSTSPGYQFYTAKYLTEPFSSSGGFCVETQYAPDAINQADFFAPLLEADRPRTQTTEYCFSTS